MQITANNVLPITTGKCHTYETQLLRGRCLPDGLVPVVGQWVGGKDGEEDWTPVILSTRDVEMGLQVPRVHLSASACGTPDFEEMSSERGPS